MLEVGDLSEGGDIADDLNLVELEFMNFQTPSQDGYAPHTSHKNLGAFLNSNPPSSLRQLTSGMFGYSSSRPTANKDYFYDIFDKSAQFKCDIEGWHTESGPGVFEAVGVPSR